VLVLLDDAGCAALDVRRQADLVFVCKLCALDTLLNRVVPPVVALVLMATRVHVPVAVAALVVAGVRPVQVHSMRAAALLLLLVLLQVPPAAAAAAGV
jgi:hypothetical protein